MVDYTIEAIMTKKEQTQLKGVWLGLERIFLIIDPKLKIETYCKMRLSGDEGFNDIMDALDYLRIAVKYQAFDVEANRREKSVLLELIGDDEE